MKAFLLTFLFLLINFIGFTQAKKVAILDFENVSGNVKYDWGKALSNMLITDLANNIHPKKVEFFERSQLNKLLDEQKLQKSKNFDEKTAVNFGKLSGVNYVFVGSIFVLDKTCTISSKLVDVQTSKIVVAKEVSGNVEDFLKLKTGLAEAIANQLNSPIILDKPYKELQITPLTLNQYLNILNSMDQGDVLKAEQNINLLVETYPKFKYFRDVKEDIMVLKQQVAKNTKDISILNNSGGRVINAITPRELVINYSNPLSTVEDRKKITLELLKFDLKEVSEGYFNEIYNINVPHVRGFGWGDTANWHNAFNFLKTLVPYSNGSKEKVLNPKTVSYYVFMQVLSYAAYMSTCEKGKVKYSIDYKMDGCTDQAISILELLDDYMETNNINTTFEKNLFTTRMIETQIFCPEELSSNCPYSCKSADISLMKLHKFLNTEFVYE